MLNLPQGFLPARTALVSRPRKLRKILLRLEHAKSANKPNLYLHSNLTGGDAKAAEWPQERRPGNLIRAVRMRMEWHGGRKTRSG